MWSVFFDSSQGPELILTFRGGRGKWAEGSIRRDSGIVFNTTLMLLLVDPASAPRMFLKAEDQLGPLSLRAV